jgi:hypothetical protein
LSGARERRSPSGRAALGRGLDGGELDVGRGTEASGLAAVAFVASGGLVTSGFVASLVATWREFMVSPNCIFDAS